MSVAEMIILRWMSGLTREDRIRNKYMRSSIGVDSTDYYRLYSVESIVDKMIERRQAEMI
jgi:hypothetical protein